MTDLRKLLDEATPGPWVFSFESTDPEWAILTTKGGSIIANVNADHRQEANVRLIAIAPQLTAALIKAEEALVAAVSTFDLLECEDDAAFCRAALAEIRALTGGNDD